MKTGTLVRCEGIITQLVFEHALRIRMKAQTSSDSSTPITSTVTPTPDTASTSSRSESDAGTDGATLDGHGEESSRASIETDTTKGKDTASSSADPKSTSSTDNLVGRLNNLVTTDLQNIVEGRDFVMLSEECYSSI